MSRYQAPPAAHQNLSPGIIVARRRWERVRMQRKGLRLGPEASQSLQALPRREGTAGGAVQDSQAARLLGVLAHGPTCQDVRRLDVQKGQRRREQDGTMESSNTTAAGPVQNCVLFLNANETIDIIR